jgi:metallopeptidase YgjP-like protein
MEYRAAPRFTARCLTGLREAGGRRVGRLRSRKLVPSWYIGGRTATDALEFMCDVADRLDNRVQLTTDGLNSYLIAVDRSVGQDIDYAQLHKVYGPDLSQDQRRYSPAKVIGVVGSAEAGDQGRQKEDKKKPSRREGGVATDRLDDLGPTLTNLDGGAVVDRSGRVVADPGMAVLAVVVGEEHGGEGPSVLDGAQARAAIQEQVAQIATRLDVVPGRVYIRGQRTKWGNCSRLRNLSFNWRLIMAPDYVLRYLVTHETVHLVLPDHSHKFWLAVQSLCPETELGRQWLAANGEELLVDLSEVL